MINIIANLLLVSLSLLNSSFLTNQFISQFQNKLTNSLLTYQKPTEYENVSDLKKYPFSLYPYKNNASVNFNFKALSGIAYDLSSGKTLEEKNKDQKLPIASLTKIITALVILKDHKLNEVVTVPEGISVGVDDQKLGIKAGEKFELSELLKASLIYSANDAAIALAIWDSGSIEKFVAKMNNYASNWGLNSSHFTNPAGLDDKEHYSSASDLNLLTKILLNNKELSQIVDTSKEDVTTIDGKKYPITNTNRLQLNYSYVHGVKTGFTANAGQSLIVYSTKNNHGMITVILNSPDRFGETKDLIDFVNANYTWK